MLAALLFQVSQLVAPLELGPAPPETRAVAAVRFEADQAEQAQQWRGLAIDEGARLRGMSFLELARLVATRPTTGAVAKFGTFSKAQLEPELAQFLFDANVGDVTPPDGTLVAQRIERDAACRQIFIAGHDAAARARADSLLRSLRADADFRQLAREQSEDRASALRRGDLALFERGADDALVRDIAFKTRLGEIAGPIESPLGFHIVQRVAANELDPRLRDDTWARARCILIAFTGAQGSDPLLEREHDEAQRIADDLATRIRRGEDMEALARQWNDDRGGRERGGDLGWVRRWTTKMPPAFDKLFIEPPGDLIGPLPSTAGFLLLRREDPGPRSRIVLRKSAFHEFLAWVCHDGAPRDELADPAWRALDQLSPSNPLDWQRWGAPQILPLVARSSSVADLTALVERLPEVAVLPRGGEFALRALARERVRPLASRESEFGSSVWPEREREIDAVLAELRSQLAPLGDVAIDELLRDLSQRDPRVVVYLEIGLSTLESNTTMAWQRLDEHAVLVRLELDRRDRADVLHAALFGVALALDMINRDESSIPAQLGQRIDRPVWNEELGALLGEESAAVLQRVLDPHFVPTHRAVVAHDVANGFGSCVLYQHEDTSERGQRQTQVEHLWREHLDGKRDVAATLDAIAELSKR